LEEHTVLGKRAIMRGRAPPGLGKTYRFTEEYRRAEDTVVLKNTMMPRRDEHRIISIKRKRWESSARFPQ